MAATFYVTDDSPSDIFTQKKTDTGISLKWSQAPTCYDRKGIIIRLFQPDNTSIDFDVYKDATTFDVKGLLPNTCYWFEMFTNYDNGTHTVASAYPAMFSFQTAAAQEGSFNRNFSYFLKHTLNIVNDFCDHDW